MQLLNLATMLVLVTAVLAVLNSRFLKLPSSIGVMVGGLGLSLILLALLAFDAPLGEQAVALVGSINFEGFVFQGVLSFLLFAGALGVNSHALWVLKGPVISFALVSTILSTALIGLVTYGLLKLFGLNVSLVYCLLFGALISPTDPVSVLGVLKQAKVPKRIETLVAGESLFNDGIGVVAFAVLASVAAAGGDGHAPALSALGLAEYFFQEAAGGLLLGTVVGLIGWAALRVVHDFEVEVLITLGVVMACTAIAGALHTSAPLAAVAAGLLVGFLKERVPAGLTSNERFESVWHLTDELLNIFLFVLLALEVVVVQFTGTRLLLGLLAIPLLLIVRAISVRIPVWLLRGRYRFPPYTRRLMVWGGLRGAISVALAFSMPAGPERELFLVMTYVIVVFSVIVQGLTVGKLAARASGPASGSPVFSIPVSSNTVSSNTDAKDMGAQAQGRK
jgi:CPA1 family monovalent cation:H+ antiporter